MLAINKQVLKNKTENVVFAFFVQFKYISSKDLLMILAACIVGQLF